jgi:hypothetical protein
LFHYTDILWCTVNNTVPVLLIIIVIQLRRMKCTRRVAPVTEMNNAHKILVREKAGWETDMYMGAYY